MDNQNATTWIVVALSAITMVGTVVNVVSTTLIKLAQIKQDKEVGDAKAKAESAQTKAETAEIRATAAEAATKKCEEEREAARIVAEEERRKDRQALASAVRALSAADKKDKTELEEKIDSLAAVVGAKKDRTDG